MSTVVENATTGLGEARESLRRAEEDLRNWRTTNQPLNPTHPTYVELKAEVTACRTVLAGAQQTLQQALAAQSRDIEQGTVPETNEQINSNVPELEASRPNMPSLNSLAIILSRPPKLFKFNTVPSTDALQVPLKPIILFTLFWTAMLNVIAFCYTLYAVQFFFLAVSCVGIYAVIAREAKFLSRFCWAQLIIDIIELIVDLFFGLYFVIGNKLTLPNGENINTAVVIFSLFLLIIIKCSLKAFFLYCVFKYWDSIREGYVTLDETTPFFGPISTE